MRGRGREGGSKSEAADAAAATRGGPGKATRAESLTTASSAQNRSEPERWPNTGEPSGLWEDIPAENTTGLLAEMGASFGTDFSGVRITHGDGKAEAAGAEAIAHGEQIHVASHRDPADRQLIGHELAHVVQQRGGRVSGASGAETIDPALENEADHAGDVAARGGRIELAGMGRGQQAGTSAPIQANRDALKGIDLYLKVNEVGIKAALKQRLRDVPWPQPHPSVEWIDSRLFGALVAASIIDNLNWDEPAEISRLLYPANHRDVLRPLLPSYTSTWLPGIGAGVSDLFEDAVRASLRRLAPRFAAAAEHDPKTVGDVEYSQLALSHPIDHHVAKTMVQRGRGRNVQYIPHAGKPDKATKPRALRTVELEWQGSKNPSLWNWVKATKPADASVEEVAATLYSSGGHNHRYESGSAQAYGITAAPPLFGLPPSWAEQIPGAKQHMPAGGKTEDRGARMLALAESKTDDELAIAQQHPAGAGAMTPKADALKVTLGDSLIAIGYVHRSLTPWSQSRFTGAAIGWITDKLAQVGSMRAKDLGTWGPIIERQKERLKAVASGVKGIVDKVAGLGIKDPSSPNAKPVAVVLATYAQAAALSHLDDTGEALIVEAGQQTQQLAITMLRGVTNDMNNAVGVASQNNQRGVQDLSNQASQITSDSQALQNQLAAGVAVDAASIEEATLHAQEVAFRTRTEGLFWAVRSLKQAVDAAGSGITSHIASRFHGKFRSLEQAIKPVEGTINEIVVNQQSDDNMVAGNWETPAEQREYRSRALKRNQKLLDELTEHTDLVEFLREGADTVQWQQFATGCVQMLALIGISIIAGAAGGAVVRLATSSLGRVGAATAVAEMAETGGMLARAGSVAARGGAQVLGAATEAAINTAAQIKLQGGAADEAFFANLLSTIGGNAIVGTLAKDLAVARSIEMRTAGMWAKVGRGGKFILKEAIAVSAHTVMNVAIGYVAHMITTSKNVTVMMTRDWLMQGLATGLGRYVGGFMKSRRPNHEKLGRLPEALGGKRLLTAGQELAALAHAAETKPAENTAVELMTKRAQVLDEELRVLEILEKNPELLAAHPDIKLNIKDIKAAISAVRSEKTKLAGPGRRLAIEAAGLEEIVPNAEYRGSADQLRRAVEHAHAMGLEVGTPKTTGKQTTIKIGDAEIKFTEGAATASAPAQRTPHEQFVEDVRSKLSPLERKKFDEMTSNRNPEQVQDQFKGSVADAVDTAKRAYQREQDATKAAAKSQVAAHDLHQWIDDLGIMKDARHHPRAREIIETLKAKEAAADKAALEGKKSEAAAAKKQARADALSDLRSYVVSQRQAAKQQLAHPDARVRKDVQVWQEQPPPKGEEPYTSVQDYKTRRAKELGKSKKGVKFDGKTILLEISDIDLLVTRDRPGKKAEILHGEEIKTGANDKPKAARDQLNDALKAINEAARGGRPVVLLEGKTNIANDLDLTTFQPKDMQTRGPEGKGFESSLDIISADLDTMVEKLLPPKDTQ